MIHFFKFSKNSIFFDFVNAYGDKFLSLPALPKEAEVAEYIKNNLSKDELEEKIYTSTRKLMRHQDNWFKKSDKRIKWINFSNSFSEADIIIKEWLEN